MEFHLSAYQCYRLRQYRTPRKLIEEICESPENTMPECPPAKLMMRVHRPPGDKDVKAENAAETTLPINKPKNILQIKGAQQQILTGVSLPNSNPSDKITVPAGFAQLVQTSTGKHILFTPSAISTTTIPGTTTGMLYIFFN